jgi:6-phosphogluconate dehydrogenase
MDLQVSTPVIDTAVSMRDLSKYKALRVQIAGLYPEKPAAKGFSDKPADYLEKLEQAFYFSMMMAYAQGMHLLFKASETYNYQLEAAQIAKIWRGGCIIRAAFLEDMYHAYQQNPALEHLAADQTVRSYINSCLPAMREIVSGAMTAGLPIPAFAASLTYFDELRSARMPSNLIQAQRDFFGAHTYELIGKEGVFHTDWQAKSN